MRQPTLFLVIGLPGAGKTTVARRLEAEENALRLTKDEWMKALFGRDNPSSASDVIEGRLVHVGLRALELGTNVVIDFGLWGRDERSALREAAAEVGAHVVMLYLEVQPEEQRRRLARRLSEAPDTTWPISEQEMSEWAGSFQAPTAGELDASEPVDATPPGFATWAEWRAGRWPPSVTR